MIFTLLDSLKDTLKSGHLYKACFLLKGSSKWKFLCIISRRCLVCYRKWTQPNLNFMQKFRKFGCAMRFNSLRVEQGVDHLISPLDGAIVSGCQQWLIICLMHRDVVTGRTWWSFQTAPSMMKHTYVFTAKSPSKSPDYVFYK